MLLGVVFLWAMAVSIAAGISTTLFMIFGVDLEIPLAICAEGAWWGWLTVAGLAAMFSAAFTLASASVMYVASAFDRIVEVLFMWLSLLVVIIASEAVMVNAWHSPKIAQVAIAVMAMATAGGTIRGVLLYTEYWASTRSRRL